MGKSKRKKSPKSSSGANTPSRPGKASPEQPQPAAKARKKRTKTMAATEKVAAQRRKQRQRTLVRRALIGVAIIAALALAGWAVIQLREVSELPNPQAKPAKTYESPKGASKEGLPIGEST